MTDDRKDGTPSEPKAERASYENDGIAALKELATAAQRSKNNLGLRIQIGLHNYTQLDMDVLMSEIRNRPIIQYD